MKTQETVLLCCVCAGLAGVVSSLATRALEESPARAEPAVRAAAGEPGAPPQAADDGRELAQLALANAVLGERVAALEARLAEVLSARSPIAAGPGDGPGAVEDLARLGRLTDLLEASGGEVTPAFVESVGQAMEEIRERERAEREARRKELLAERIEERLTELQLDLGLSSRQVSDLRTLFLEQEEKRATLLEELREGEGDRRTMFDGMRSIRDATLASLETVLTPEQLALYRASERDYGGPGDFGGFGREFPGRDGPERTRPR